MTKNAITALLQGASLACRDAAKFMQDPCDDAYDIQPLLTQAMLNCAMVSKALHEQTREAAE